ncbi:hypothetical protein [Anaerosporobacter sp.]
MKKNLKVFVLFSILSLLVCSNGCARRSSKNNENKSDDLYEATLEEIEQINNNSNFFGYKLLDDAPKNAVSGLPQTLRKDASDDIYYIDSYHGSTKIVTMILKSSDANLLGISPGDSKQDIEEKLDESNFTQDKSTIESRIRYEAYHINLIFDITKDGFIETISISIADPTEVRPDY